MTGYLGSGKTTLIRSALSGPEAEGTAVIVNELGEIGIDHAILRQVDERTVLLASGCLCCAMRGDLVDELRDLLDRRGTGEIPWFRRVVVETTGLADPAPILNTLVSEPLIRHQYAVASVVATIDSQHGLRGPESLQQAAAADVLVLTKPDLADGVAVEQQVRALNPLAKVHRAVRGALPAGTLFAPDGDDDLARRVAVATPAGHAVHRHDDARAVSLTLDGPIDWPGFGVWLTMLLHARGREILRVKGLLDLGGTGPVLVNAVQHVVHPPEHLDAWPDADRRSRLVVIGRGFADDELERSFRAFATPAAL